MRRMAGGVKLSHTAAMILQAVHVGYRYGFSVMEQTGLPSGTVYPALRRLERDGLIESAWEQQEVAEKEQRPARKYYVLTRAGTVGIEVVHRKYPLLERLVLERPVLERLVPEGMAAELEAQERR
jgi:PadR family transcriptional regulator PadR